MLVTQEQLLRLIAHLHEKAYRRGFQQGHLAGLGMLGGAATPTPEEVAAWRFGGGYATSPDPPGSPLFGHHQDPLARLLAEADRRELRDFLDGLLTGTAALATATEGRG